MTSSVSELFTSRISYCCQVHLEPPVLGEQS